MDPAFQRMHWSLFLNAFSVSSRECRIRRPCQHDRDLAWVWQYAGGSYRHMGGVSGLKIVKMEERGSLLRCLCKRQREYQMRKILLVEDEDPAIRNLKRTLESDGYHVYIARSGKEARAFMANHRANLVLLDLNLPDIDGLRLGSELREWDPHLPIIVVSVIVDGDKKVRAFKVCADDFVSKPYHMDELLERIRVQLRHADHMHAGSVPPKIISGPLEVDLEQRLIRVHFQPVELA